MLHETRCSRCGEINSFMDAELIVDKKISEQCEQELKPIYNIINANNWKD
jgi:hypothetical protein